MLANAENTHRREKLAPSLTDFDSIENIFNSLLEFKSLYLETRDTSSYRWVFSGRWIRKGPGSKNIQTVVKKTYIVVNQRELLPIVASKNARQVVSALKRAAVGCEMWVNHRDRTSLSGCSGLYDVDYSRPQNVRPSTRANLVLCCGIVARARTLSPAS